MNMTYFLLNPREPELANRLRKRFPATFGGPRRLHEEAREVETKSPEGSGTHIPFPQAA